jgi:hypothetical protein
MQRNVEIRDLHAYFALPSADADAVIQKDLNFLDRDNDF